jgi:hypothetical protein
MKTTTIGRQFDLAMLTITVKWVKLSTENGLEPNFRPGRQLSSVIVAVSEIVV